MTPLTSDLGARAAIVSSIQSELQEPTQPFLDLAHHAAR